MNVNADYDPDIVEIIMQACRADGLDDEAAQRIECSIRAEYGGLRIRIPKTKKHLTRDQRRQIFAAGVANVPTAEITSKYKIGVATLYRIMKQGS